MCGICGFAGLENQTLLERMTALLEHRGPDSVGFFASPEASLGFRRLSLIDLDTGDQPLANEDGSLRLVLNGEVYNYRELREGLERRGHRFATRSDAEVVLHLYEEKGPELLGELQGMFAFALWDARTQSLLLARDRLGIKPLHYTTHAGAFYFSSEAKAFLAHPAFPRRLNANAVRRLLDSLYLPGRETLLEGVHRLPPGYWLRWQRGTVRLERFWEPHLFHTRRPGQQEAAADFRRRFEEAVGSHLVSDVPVGALLSGGVDSAGVVAQMVRLLDRPPKTFTAGFPGAIDERTQARRLAELYRTDHYELELDPRRFIEDLPRMVWYLEEPTPISFLPVFYLAEFARKQVKAVLLGEGADELFAGYRRLLPFYPAFGFLPFGWQQRMYRFAFHGVKASALLPPYGGTRAGDPAAWPGTGWQRNGQSRLGAALNFEQREPLPNYQLHRVDRMTMAHGLEARVPYLDHRLVEYVNSLPDKLKLSRLRRKRLLREALAGLVPEDVLAGTKRGLAAPFRLWYTAEFLDAARAYVNEKTMRERGWIRPAFLRELYRPHAWGWMKRRRGNQLFLLLTLELYCRLFIDPAPEELREVVPARPPQVVSRGLQKIAGNRL